MRAILCLGGSGRTGGAQKAAAPLGRAQPPSRGGAAARGAVSRSRPDGAITIGAGTIAPYLCSAASARCEAARAAAVATACAAIVLAPGPVAAQEFYVRGQGQDSETNMENIPSNLGRPDPEAPQARSLSSQVNRDDKQVQKQVTTCVRKCVPTCIRGGGGAPGLGPMSLRKAPVVFKDGYRSRDYCLSECVGVCSVTDGKARQ